MAPVPTSSPSLAPSGRQYGQTAGDESVEAPFVKLIFLIKAPTLARTRRRNASQGFPTTGSDLPIPMERLCSCLHMHRCIPQHLPAQNVCAVCPAVVMGGSEMYRQLCESLH